MASDDLTENMRERYIQQTNDRANEELNNAAPLIERFICIAGTKGISLSSSSFTFAPTIGIVASEPSLARKLLGIASSERDGLLSYDDISERMLPSGPMAGYFYGNNYILMAHSCYRRRMYPFNNWAPNFLEIFWRLKLNGVKKYIAIDEDRVRVNIDFSTYREYDTWFGAPFNGNVAKIKNGIVKLKPPEGLNSDKLDFFFEQAYGLDIKWSEANGIKTFQALELKSNEVTIEFNGEEYFPARYLHAEFDMSAGHFRHFDGAIQYFTKDEYNLRKDGDFNLTLKNLSHVKAYSKKVFKLNGPVSTDTWVELCCHFFTANPLMHEYFSGVLPKHISEALERLRLNMP